VAAPGCQDRQVIMDHYECMVGQWSFSVPVCF